MFFQTAYQFMIKMDNSNFFINILVLPYYHFKKTFFDNTGAFHFTK